MDHSARQPASGMGVVLRARDPDFNRTLAVKLLAENLNNQEEFRRRLVGKALEEHGADAPAWLRRAQKVHPDDLPINVRLAALLRKTAPADAISYYRAALAILPPDHPARGHILFRIADLQKKLGE